LDKALEVVLAALPKCFSDLGPNHKLCRILVVSKSTVMLQLGMASRASEDVQLLEVIASDETSPPLRVGTAVLLLKIASATRSASALDVAFERVNALLESGEKVPLPPTVRAKALLALAESKLHMNEPVEAEAWIQKADAALRAGASSAAVSRLDALARALSGVSRMQMGRFTDALQQQYAAQDAFVRLYGTNDPTTRLFSLNLAMTLGHLGRDDAALRLASEAVDALRTSMGSEAPTYLRARDFERDLLRGNAGESASRLRAGRPAFGFENRQSQRIDFFS
jgi:tetratricopeptide (TPR) repeat protein